MPASSGLSDADIAAYARQAGFSGNALVTMLAIAFGESCSSGPPCNPAAVGDQGITDAKWGPSIGVTQVRSLWAERGTGGSRDPTRLADPAFNLRSAWEISGGGSNFKPWSVFSSGRYREFLARAWRAVAGSPGSGRLPTGITGLEIPGAGVVEEAVEPFLSGLRRIALVGLLLAGGVALIGAGGWRTVQEVRGR